MGEAGRPPLYATSPTIALSGHVELKKAEVLEHCGEVLGISVETGPCGHAPGAVWMRLGGDGGLVYSGDVSMESTLFKSSLPPRAEALVFDASYGTADTPLAEQVESLDDAIDGPGAFRARLADAGWKSRAAISKGGVNVSLCPSHRHVARTLLAARKLAGGRRVRRARGSAVARRPPGGRLSHRRRHDRRRTERGARCRQSARRADDCRRTRTGDLHRAHRRRPAVGSDGESRQGTLPALERASSLVRAATSDGGGSAKSGARCLL